MTTQHLATVIKRDANYVGRAIVSVVFAGFAMLAVAAAVIDILPHN